MTPYQQEVLEGHRELVADCGTTITFDGSAAAYGVVLVFPEESNDSENAGTQARAKKGIEIERAFYAAAGVNEFSRFRIAGQAQLLHVTGIEDDPGSPTVFFSAEEVQ